MQHQKLAVAVASNPVSASSKQGVTSEVRCEELLRNRVSYDLSDHLREEIARRGIPLPVVESVLENPQQKVPEHGHVMCYQSKIEINQKEYLGA